MRLENVSMPFLINNVATTLVTPTMISKHHNGYHFRIHSVRAFLFCARLGKLRWEYWTTSPHRVISPENVPLFRHGGSTVFLACAAYGLSHLDEHDPRYQRMVSFSEVSVGMALILFPQHEGSL